MPYLVGIVDVEEEDWLLEQGYELCDPGEILEKASKYDHLGRLYKWVAVVLDGNVQEHLLAVEEQ